MKSKIYVVLLIAAFTAGVFLKIKSCNSDNLATSWKARYDTLSADYKVLKSKEGKQVAEQRPAMFADNKLLKAASAKVFNLSKKEERKIKEVQAFVQVDQSLVVKDDSAVLRPVEDSTDALSRFAINRPLYKLAGRISDTWLYVDSLAVYNTISLRLAEKRKGLFKRELVVQAINSNPYIFNSGIKSMVVERKPTAWNKWIKPALFAVGGYAIGRGIK